MPTVAQLLSSSGLATPEARALLAQVVGLPRESLIAWPERDVDEQAARSFRTLTERRRAGEPFAYLVGEREFFGRAFGVTPAVLVPRPETELLVELALKSVADVRRPRLLDLGTGSGCIAITVALERPDAEVVAVDRSAPALAVARRNATGLNARVAFAVSDWYSNVEGSFDCIVANPPYVAPDDPHLAALAHEPPDALVAAAGGLACLAAIIGDARRWLRTNGRVLVEHGFDQGSVVRDLLAGAGFAQIETTHDAAGLERVSAGRQDREDDGR